MDNFSKAFYMAGATVIALLVLFLMIYMFREAAKVGENYDSSKGRENVDSFNAKFERFQASDEKSDISTDSDTVYKTDPNVASDVVSAINLAYNINKKSGNDPVNNVEVYVYLKNNTVAYSLLNNGSAKKNTMFKGTDTGSYITTNKFLNLEVDTGKFLSDTKIQTNTNKVIYRYTFLGNLEYNKQTGKVNKVNFRLMENSDF